MEKTKYSLATRELKKHKKSLSNPRLKILEYLCYYRDHPTAEQMYVDLHKELPTLSKTTIYNTLHALAELGLVKILNFEENKARYDIITEEHGHFKCQTCGGIFDFQVEQKLIPKGELLGYKIMERNLYFKGICKKCL